MRKSDKGRRMSDNFIPVLRHSCANQNVPFVLKKTFDTHLLKQTNPTYAQFSMNAVLSNSGGSSISSF